MNDAKRQIALAVLSEVSRKPLAAIAPEMDLVADLGIDSPKALELLVRLEERLSFEISDEDAGRMNTVGDVLAYVARQG